VNLILSLFAAIILHFTGNIPTLADFLSTFITLNIILMVFNLLPVPPLDGSKIWHLFLSNENYYALEQMGPFILLGVLVFSYSFGGFLMNFIGASTQYIYNLLT
jgi:Zn-dependent protease